MIRGLGGNTAGPPPIWRSGIAPYEVEVVRLVLQGPARDSPCAKSFDVHLLDVVSLQPRTVLQLLALAAASLWIAALFAPIRHVALDPRDAEQAMFGSQPFAAFRLAVVGWLGPLILAPGWFANIPFAICLVRMFLGKPPGNRMAWVAAILAATALLPNALFDWRSVRVMGFVFWGPALLLWLSAHAIVWLAMFEGQKTEPTIG